MEYLASAHWIVASATIVVVVTCVAVHYAVLSNCNRVLSKSRRRPGHALALIFVILMTHVVEIWLFALAYYFLARFGDFGGIAGAQTLVDYAYYSATAYTTLGFGDLVPVGPLRFATGMEALTGLVMITWSASLTFLEMQRDWKGTQR